MLGPNIVAVVQAASSRRMVAWRRGSSEEESRAYLQARLTTLFKLLFWCFIALMAFIFSMYALYGEWVRPGSSPPQGVVPKNQPYVYGAFAVGVTIQAFIWRVLLLRKKLTLEQLHHIDTAFAIGSNFIIAFCAMVSADQRQSAYTCLIYTCWTVLTRALIVPSTGKRTALVSALAMAPFGIVAAWLSGHSTWVAAKDVPPNALIAGYVQIAAVAVLLSASGSRIIYGLRQKAAAVQQLGQYSLGRLLGQGGNGKVYMAHHVLLRRPTAIKLVPAAKIAIGTLERFEREVQVMSQLTHPNTVAVYDYGHGEGTFYYAMEYLGGGVDLQNLVVRHGKQPPERVRQILIQVCGALQEAHERNLIHRDIKPANIILCERGGMPDVVKVLDYGLVKELTTETGASQQVVLGTPAYIAPEAVTDPSKVGPGVDLYACGAVGYFLLSAQRVFHGATDLDTCLQHVTKAPPPLAEHGIEVPPALEAILMKCLAKQPGDRYPSAQALADALRDLGSLGDWDDDRAAAWWAKHRPTDVPSSVTEQPTTTLSIDLKERQEESEAA